MASAVLVPMGAEAKYGFECGIYKVQGKVQAFPPRVGADQKPRPVMPLLVLWDGTMSRTQIPLKADPGFMEQLGATASKRPLNGEFTIQIRERGFRPSNATLQKIELPTAEALVSRRATPKLLKKTECAPPVEPSTGKVAR